MIVGAPGRANWVFKGPDKNDHIGEHIAAALTVDGEDATAIMNEYGLGIVTESGREFAMLLDGSDNGAVKVARALISMCAVMTAGDLLDLGMLELDV